MDVENNSEIDKDDNSGCLLVVTTREWASLIFAALAGYCVHLFTLDRVRRDTIDSVYGLNFPEVTLDLPEGFIRPAAEYFSFTEMYLKQALVTNIGIFAQLIIIPFIVGCFGFLLAKLLVDRVDPAVPIASESIETDNQVGRSFAWISFLKSLLTLRGFISISFGLLSGYGAFLVVLAQLRRWLLDEVFVSERWNTLEVVGITGEQPQEKYFQLSDRYLQTETHPFLEGFLYVNPIIVSIFFFLVIYGLLGAVRGPEPREDA